MTSDASSPRPGIEPIPGNIYLVGLMGGGKTSVGRLLARRLHKEFVDSDHEIEARTGVKGPVIVEMEGEAGVRKRESSVGQDLVRQTDIVLATGGGAAIDPQTRAALDESGTVIYLRAAPSELYFRTRHDRNRPLLRTADPLSKLEELHRIRDPLYRDCAHLIVDTGNQAIRSLVSRIERELRDRARCDCAPGMLDQPRQALQR